MSGCSCFDKGATCIFEEVLLELVGVLLLVHVTVHLLKVLSGCSWFDKGATCIIEDLLLVLVGVNLDVPVGVLLEELLKVVSEVSSVAH